MYRAWGDLPPERGLWAAISGWLLGGWQHLLYIGITERTAVARWAEHLERKTWAPDIACWERDPKVWPSQESVLAAERAAIVAERPVHNVAHNGNNPGAVRRRRHLPRHVVRARMLWAARACVWLALFAGFWLAVGNAWPGWEGPRNSAIAASLVSAAALAARAYDRKKRRKTRRRRTRR
ncbi:hypothetical protein QQG74_09475 [Micromonospora sp. FIMYZ51]|uniref:hypothetical protein n=1 Tax=Micromonospora sp. FIMYZ51 TaxID=3051832 RepID=UPI00311E66DB